jgi:hypothetical protein
MFTVQGSPGELLLEPLEQVEACDGQIRGIREVGNADAPMDGHLFLGMPSISAPAILEMQMQFATGALSLRC